MSNENIKVLAGELTVHRQTAVLRDANGNEIGIQQGRGRILYKDDVVHESEVSPLIVSILDDEDHPSHKSVSKKIVRVGDEPAENLAARLHLPFDGYDDADEDQILAAMAVLPSSTIQAIKRYEGANKGREAIANYNIGFAQDPRARIEGRHGSGLDAEGRDNANKATAALVTREVTENDVRTGEGITGTGDPDNPTGNVPTGDDDNGDDNENSAPKPAAQRRSRRARGSNAKGESKSE